MAITKKRERGESAYRTRTQAQEREKGKGRGENSEQERGVGNCIQYVTVFLQIASVLAHYGVMFCVDCA